MWSIKQPTCQLTHPYHTVNVYCIINYVVFSLQVAVHRRHFKSCSWYIINMDRNVAARLGTWEPGVVWERMDGHCTPPNRIEESRIRGIESRHPSEVKARKMPLGIRVRRIPLFLSAAHEITNATSGVSGDLLWGSC